MVEAEKKIKEIVLGMFERDLSVEVKAVNDFDEDVIVHISWPTRGHSITHKIPERELIQFNGTEIVSKIFYQVIKGTVDKRGCSLLVSDSMRIYQNEPVKVHKIENEIFRGD